VTGAAFSEVDLDLLADYVGGALAGTPQEATVAGLIAADPAWTTAHDELSAAMASVSAQLGAWGAVSEPMPAEVARRLDAAFASAVTDPAPIDPELAAPSVDAASGRHLTAVPDDGVDREDGERKRPSKAAPRRRMRWATPIAVAAGVIAFVGFGVDYLNGQSRSEDTASSSAAGSADAKSAPSGAGVEGSAPKQEPGNAPMMTTDRAEAASPPQRVLTSGRDYQLASLAGTTSAGLENNSPGPGVMSSLNGVTGPLARLVSDDALAACLRAIAAQNAAGPITATPVVDYARFQGSPALIVRFVAANGEWVWATSPSCGLPGVGASQLASVKVG
jgi:hypothetical protein